MITLTGKTMICGEAGSGKSTLLTAIAQTIMADDAAAAMVYYGTSLSYEKFLLDSRGARASGFSAGVSAPV